MAATILREASTRKLPFAQLSNEMLQNRELSFVARGMLGYLLSKPTDWKVRPTDLKQGIGMNKVYSTLKELIDAGYITRTREYDKKHHVKAWIYEVTDTPLVKSEQVDSSQVRTEQVENGDHTKKEDTKTEEKRVAPPPLPIAPKTLKPTKTQPKAKPERKPQITTPLFEAIDRDFFNGAGGSNPIVAAILNGREKQHLDGIVKSEMARQHKTKEELDFNAMALMVPKFKDSLPIDSTTGQKIELRDPIKFCVRWNGWRNTTNRLSCPPKIYYDPNCKHHCDKGYITRPGPDGFPETVECECRMDILEPNRRKP